MILTYKIKHHQDFSDELRKAKQIAQYVVEHHPHSAKFSSKDVKQFGLKSVISNQIIRKYGRNRRIKRVNKVKLTIPNQGIQYSSQTQVIRITSLKLELKHEIPILFDNINQIEVDNEYLYDMGNRNGKNFECPSCGHVEHADVNAAFNIALSPNIVRFATESDVAKGNTGIPKAAMI